MKISIGTSPTYKVPARDMRIGDVGTIMKAGIDEPIVVVKNWAGLFSLDGQYAWIENSSLESILVTPLHQGTTVVLTV